MFRVPLASAIIIHTLLVFLILYQSKSKKGDSCDCAQLSSVGHFANQPQRQESRTHVTVQLDTFKEQEVPAWVKERSGRQMCRTRGPFTILVTVNFEFLPLFFNWVESLNRLGLTCNVTLAPEDNLVTDYLSRHPMSMLNIAATDERGGKNSIHVDERKQYKGRYSYLNMINKRMSYMLTLLKSGSDVLLADTDAVWLQDPLPIIKETYSQFDVWIAKGKKNMPCPCFMYVKYEASTIDLVERWIQKMENNRKKLTDQEALSKVLYGNQAVKVKNLDINRFPTGMEFFDKSWNDLRKGDVFVAHGNHLGRFEHKIDKFKEFNIWFSNETNFSF